MRTATTTLKDGRTLLMEEIHQPTHDQLNTIRTLLFHKPSQYSAHFEEFFTTGQNGLIEDLEWRFHLASCEGIYIGNICTWEYQGIGILGHVFTHLDWRQLGIAHALLDFQETGFVQRQGRIMELNTGYLSMPYTLYQKHGYVGIPGAPGSMLKVYRDEWESLYKPEPVSVSHFQWRHWPSANLLFLSEHPAYIRCSGIGVYNPGSIEGNVVYLRETIWQLNRDRAGQVMVLEKEDGTVVGWASQMVDPNWSYREKRWIYDLFVHPHFSDQLEPLLNTIELRAGVQSYSTPDDPKNPILEKLGFREKGRIHDFFLGGQELVVFTM